MKPIPLSKTAVESTTSTGESKHVSTSQRTPKKPPLKERARKLRLQALAIHECAHAMAALHYEVPIGDEGVWVKWEQEHFFGFCDTRESETGTPVTLSVALTEQPEEYLAYLVGFYVGPIAEFYRLLDAGRDPRRIIDKNKCQWLADFAGSIGIRGKENAARSVIICTPGEIAVADCLLRRAFLLLSCVMGWRKEPDLPPIVFGETGMDLAPLHRAAVIDSATLVNLYRDEIRSLADLLLASPSHALTKEQIYEWADQNFKRKNLREHVNEGDAA